jgi:hypothetical protein
MAYARRSIILAILTPDGASESRTVTFCATSPDDALRDAHMTHDAFGTRESLATTAALLAAHFTKRGEWRKRTKAQRARSEAAWQRSNADIDARRAAYWATRGAR